MRGTWQLQDAKNRLSEVVEKAEHEGPQRITKRGREAVIVLSCKDYRRLRGQSEDLVTFFRRSPLRGLKIERNKGFPREIEL